MTLVRRRVSDPAALKVLAHPLRVALLDLLVAEGPLTATEAALRVRSTPSNCSWHLRLLARHGFVREARGSTGRHRPWRAVAEGLAWQDDEGAEPGAPGVVDDALVDLRLEQEVQRLRTARALQAGAGPSGAGWRSVGAPATRRVWLTEQEAQQVAAEIAAVLDRYADRGEPPEGARPAAVVSWLVPTGPVPESAGLTSRTEPAGPAGPR